MDPKFVKQIQQLKRQAYAYFQTIPNSSPDADDITNHIIDSLKDAGSMPDEDTIKKIESIVSGNHLVEKLEKLVGKKIVLLEMPGLKQNELIAYLTAHPGATEKEMSNAIWGRMTASAQMGIRRAMSSNLIRRDTTQRPMKYYAVAQVQQPKQVVQPVAPQAEPERQKRSAADLVAFLTQHPGATTPEIVQGVWNRDYYKLKGTSLLMAPIQMMQRALKNRLITRDETKTPYKYYAAGTQTTAMQAQNQVAGKKTYEEYVKLIIKYLTKHPGAAVKDLFQFFPTQISAVPVVQKMLKVGLIVRDMSQKPAKWYVKGTQPSNVSTVIPPKVTRVGNKQELLKQIAADFKSFLGYEDVEINENSVSKSFRDLGDWIDDEEDSYEKDDPDSDEYDPGWREDNDNKIWAPGEYKRYAIKFRDWAKGHSWYKKVDLEIETGEKSYCDFTITLKK